MVREYLKLTRGILRGVNSTVLGVLRCLKKHPSLGLVERSEFIVKITVHFGTIPLLQVKRL